MAFAVLGGVTLKLLPGVREREPEYRGEAVRAFNGALLVGTDAPRRTWEGQTVPMSTADVDTLLAVIGTGAPVTLTGDIVRGASVSVSVQASREFVGTANPAVHEEVLTLTIREV